MDDRVNYLTTLNPTVFEHLFKFLGATERYVSDQNVLIAAYNISLPRAPAGQIFPYNQASEYFHKSARVAVIWESASLAMDLTNIFHVWNSSSGFEVQDHNSHRRYKTHIKHLGLVTTYFDLGRKLYDFLTKEFVCETSTLKTLTVVIRSYNTVNIDYRTPSFPPVSQMLKEMVRMGVQVSLEVDVTGVDLWERDFRFYSDIAADEEICRHITWLKMQGWLSVSRLFALVEKLPVLQHLELDILHLREDILHALAQRVRRNPSLPLRTFTVFLGTKGQLRFSDLPDLSQQAWDSLVQVCPGLQVSCFLHCVPDKVLLTVLKPNVPLVNITIFDQSPESQNNIISTCKHFSQTLQFFRCFTDTRFQTGNFEELVSDRYMMSLVTREGLPRDLSTSFTPFIRRIAPGMVQFALTITVI